AVKLHPSSCSADLSNVRPSSFSECDCWHLLNRWINICDAKKHEGASTSCVVDVLLRNHPILAELFNQKMKVFLRVVVVAVVIETTSACDCNFQFPRGCYLVRAASPGMACKCVFSLGWTCRLPRSSSGLQGPQSRTVS
ncbi:hypothetical protein DAPPUDRAFT_101571, partial [Daphnia pulex]